MSEIVFGDFDGPVAKPKKAKGERISLTTLGKDLTKLICVGCFESWPVEVVWVNAGETDLVRPLVRYQWHECKGVNV